MYIFTSGNVGKHHRAQRFEQLLHDGHRCFSSVQQLPVQSIETCTQFKISSYLEQPLVPAEIRGFRQWFEAYVGLWENYRDVPTCHNGLFKTNATYLLQRPKTFYETLLKQTTVHRDTEVVHYLERAACAVFGPLL
jgi:hypothetical protein